MFSEKTVCGIEGDRLIRKYWHSVTIPASSLPFVRRVVSGYSNPYVQLVKYDLHNAKE
jgi:hypothetical protein